MTALIVSTNLATALTPTTTPATPAGKIDGAMDSAFEFGIEKAGPIAVLPPLAGYDGFDANMKMILRQTFLSQCMAIFVGAWTAPALINSWANAGGYEVAGYRLEAGRVWLKGSIAGGANGTVAFTLPAEFRPALKVRMQAAGSVVEVGTNGDVTITTTGTIGLDGVSFAL